MKQNRTTHAGEPGSTPLRSQTDPPHRILVVDEDRDLRQLYAEALAGPAYHVDAAEDGATAWEALKTNRYHLLITEHAIPHVTGVELVKMLRAARMALPVVMAAGRLPAQELARNPSLQLAATLSKPFAVEALLDTVKNVLRVTDPAPEQLEPMPVPGKASRQPMVSRCEDFDPHSRIQLTIKHPDAVLAEDVKISHRGNLQERRIGHLPYLQVMLANQQNKALTFGDLSKGGCQVCGKRPAIAIIAAAKARLILFQGHRPFKAS